MTTHLVPLGKNGPKIPQLGLGLMGLSYETYGSILSDEERFAFLDKALDIGAVHWDTSDLYGDGEELLNKWFQRTGARSKIFLATKFGFVKGQATQKGYKIDSSAEYCVAACEESLRTLGVEFIDLYYVHHVNPETPIEETMRAMAELQAAGKIKHIGLSAVSSATLLRAIKIAPIAAVQMDYSPFVLEVEGPSGTDILATCRELGIAMVCASPLGRGLFTSTFASGLSLGDEKDIRVKVMPRLMPENRKQNEKAVKEFEALARKKGCSVSQLALAWLMKQGSDVIPIPGSRKVEHLVDNWGALEVRLSEEEEGEVRKFVEGASVGGTSLPEAFRGFNYRDTREEAV